MKQITKKRAVKAKTTNKMTAVSSAEIAERIKLNDIRNINRARAEKGRPPLPVKKTG